MIVLYLLLGIVGLFVLYLVIWTLICAVYDLGIDPKKEYMTESPFARRLVEWSAWNMLRLGRIRLHVGGLEKLPEENMVFVCNHRSNFDALSAVTAFFIYPDGTRSLEVGPMGTLHPGVFKIAQKAKKPVAICAIQGTETAKKRWPFRSTNVYLDVLEVMDAETVRHTKVADIAAHMKEIVDVHIEGEKK